MSEALDTLQADVTCPVCLFHLKEPVTISCGHNFCNSCIRVLWHHREDTLLCPVCRHPHEENSFNANSQLGRLVDLVKLLHQSRNEEVNQEEVHLCKRHDLVLTFFCEKDQELLCSMCSLSSAHKSHYVRPIREAASHHRQRLSFYMQTIKKLIAEGQTLLRNQDRKRQELKEQMEKQKSQLASEFEFLEQLVNREQLETFSRLDEEDKVFQQKCKANLTEISHHILTLKKLREELAEKSVMSNGDMLREVKSLQYRFENLECPSVWFIPFKKKGYSLPPLYSELENIIHKFQEEVILDPQTAHPSLFISEDKKTVNYMRKRSKDKGKLRELDDIVVLGSKGYSFGRHYWEVQVGDKPEWAVGVCIDLTCSKGQQSLSGQKRCWTLGLQDGNYQVMGSVPTFISLKDKPTGIGIYLDYELGQVSFYNVSDRSHIYSLMEMFSDVLKPYFRVGQDIAPLTVQ